jgi:hypothetical protein
MCSRAALDRRWRLNSGVAPEQVDILADCARDTIALAASLAEERPFVLTTRRRRARPELSDYLSCTGIPCHHVSDITALRLLRTALAPLLVHAGLVEMAATGSLHLAAVSLLAPGFGAIKRSSDGSRQHRC